METNRAAPWPFVGVYEPVSVALANADRIKQFFDVMPATLIQWHEDDGFPIFWRGVGRGRKGFVPLREARAWMKRRAWNRG